MTKDEALKLAQDYAEGAQQGADSGYWEWATVQAQLATAYATMALALPESARRPPDKEWMDD